MPPAPRSTACFELKSAALTLISVVVKTADLALLAADLHQRLGDTPGMFEQEPVVIDITQLRDADSTVDFSALAALLRGHSLVPVAVKGGNALQMAAALHAGLAEAPEGQLPVRATQQAAEAAAPADGTHADGTPADATQVSPAAPAPPSGPAFAEEPATGPAGEPASEGPFTDVPALLNTTRVIDRPLRSGQQVYARNADLVVMAVVSHGAEVIADGHIHVYGPLRGRAIAGAKGDTSARIFTTCMEPQLISIAGIYRTTETELPANVLGKPAQVRLDGERLVVEPLGG